jgi:hypothetical protein
VSDTSDILATSYAEMLETSTNIKQEIANPTLLCDKYNLPFSWKSMPFHPMFFVLKFYDEHRVNPNNEV